jgi:hypothetical protein
LGQCDLQVAADCPIHWLAGDFVQSPFYDACVAVRADPSKATPRQQRDAVLRPEIRKVWDDNWKV